MVVKETKTTEVTFDLQDIKSILCEKAKILEGGTRLEFITERDYSYELDTVVGIKITSQEQI